MSLLSRFPLKAVMPRDLEYLRQSFKAIGKFNLFRKRVA